MQDFPSTDDGSNNGTLAPNAPDLAPLTANASANTVAAYTADPVQAGLSGQAERLWDRLCSDQTVQLSAFETQAVLFILRHSPHLTRVASGFPDFFTASIKGQVTPSDAYADLSALTAKDDELRVMTTLRHTKAKISLWLAVCDIMGKMQTREICEHLSNCADLCLQAALGWLMAKAYEKGDITPTTDTRFLATDLTKTASECGFTILALGKHGGQELNYSSDIDLVFIYDPDKIAYCGRKDLRSFCQRLSQTLVRLIEQTTADGYVFRVDLRLRPDPSSTPLAIPIGALESYYHSKALNWERAAYIKARVAAGDTAIGEAFLAAMEPWVWRRSIDFAALDELAKLKHQVEEQASKSARGGSKDIKVGAGGIREIEFFAQIQQLLFAGRDTSLRSSKTQEALSALATAKRIPPQIANSLTALYWQYRTLEHRLQMVNDAQTHALPQSPQQLCELAHFAGFENADALSSWVSAASSFVRHHYASLLPQQPENSGAKPYALPTDPDKLSQYLDAKGFDNLEQVVHVISLWRRQEYRALKTPRAHDLLEEILPELVSAFSQSPDPAAAIISCDRFFERMPASVPLFSFLKANPDFYSRMIRVMTVSTAMAEALSRHPERWGAVLEPGYMQPLPTNSDFEQALRARLKAAKSFEDGLDISRIYKAETQMRVSLQLIDGLITPPSAAALLANLADSCLRCVYELVHQRFMIRHGGFADCAMHAVALGRYGGGHLTTESDLDVIFYYSTGPDTTPTSMSDGAKPLSPSQYFSRLGQQVITAITSPTREGFLYELDARLRPCGSQGPLVVHISSIEKYYSTEQDQGGAWVWEFMAQTRARHIVLGDKTAVAERINYPALLRNVSPDPKLLADITDMHNKLKGQRDTGQHWDIKLRSGGLVDIEFLVQYLLLRDIASKGIPCPCDLPSAIRLLADQQSLSSSDAEDLIAITDYYEKLLLLLRLCFKSSRNVPRKLPVGVADLLIAQTGAPDQQSLRKKLSDSCETVLQIFSKITGQLA